MKNRVRILHGFFCEHLRTEVTGQITAIGIWGEECRLLTKGPAILNSLAFYAYVTNPDHLPISGRATFDIPGMGQGPAIPLLMESHPEMCGLNINLAIGSLMIQSPGVIKVKIVLDFSPPIISEFSLDIKFNDPTAMPKNGPIKLS